MRGGRRINYSDPVFDKSGWLKIGEINTLDISEITHSELVITDVNSNFGFMTIYATFITLFFSNHENISEIVELMGGEAII